ncbi:MAG: flagellar hook-length control protein FliK [Phycisphaerales bacterium]|nr:flagellar hook-length control protein FliK [Phycisphaerales bacterium]
MPDGVTTADAETVPPAAIGAIAGDAATGATTTVNPEAGRVPATTGASAAPTTAAPTASVSAASTTATSAPAETTNASAASVAAAPQVDPAAQDGTVLVAAFDAEAPVHRSRGPVGTSPTAGREHMAEGRAPNATIATPATATADSTAIDPRAGGSDMERAARERLRAPAGSADGASTAAEARAAQINAAVDGRDAAATVAPPSGAGADGPGSTSMTMAQGAREAALASADPAPAAAPVLRGLSTLLAQKGGTLTLRLDPPDLGQVRIAVTIQGTTVSASLLASGSEARTLLEGSLGQLRAALEMHGLTVERLAVDRLTPDRLALERLGTEARNDRASASAPAAPARSETGGHGSAGGSGQDGARNDGQRQDAAEGQSRGRRDAEQGRNGRHPATRRVFTETFAAVDGGRERTAR